jgi:stage V sporulation protein B
MSKKTFLRGAAILGIAGLMVQVMGAVFRIPLGNIIGDEGMGYYQTAYPIYVFLLVFSTNGAPAAISKMTSERIAKGSYGEAHRVFRLSFILMGVLGIVAASVFFFGAEAMVEMLGNPGARYAMMAIAPALLFVPVMSVYRGYFQGMQQMGPTALSQLGEQAARVAIGLTLAIVLIPRGLEAAAAGATFGTSIGPILGVLILAIIYKRRQKSILAEIVSQPEPEHRESSGSILKTLAWIAVPITIGVSILPIMNIVDVLLVMTRMQATGFSQFEANALYGQLTGMAGPVINLPMALALSMALSMVPAIAAANSIGDRNFLEVNIKLGLRTAMIIGVPCSFGLMALSEPIMTLLYPLQEASAVSASRSLFLLATGVIFLCIAQAMAGILQGLGHPGVAVYGLLTGLVVKTISTYILTGIPSLNVEGAAIGSSLGFCAIGLFNLLAVRKLTGITFDQKISVWKPLIAGAIMFLLVVGIYQVTSGILGNSISTLLAIGAGAAVYGILLIRIRAISPHEIRLLPKGEKLERLLIKFRLIREEKK